MSTGSSGLAVRRGLLPLVRDARIRAKLAGLLVIPLVAVLVLASGRLMDVRGRATDAGRVADLTRLGTDLSGLSLLLHRERMAAAVYLASPEASPDAFRAASEHADAQILVFRGHRAGLTEVPARVRVRLQLIQDRLGALTDLRGAVAARKEVTLVSAVERYDEVLDGLSDYEETVSQIAEPGAVADGLRALAAFTRLQSAAADQEVAAYVVRVGGPAGATWRQQLIGAQAARQDAFDDFRQIATAGQTGRVEATLANDAMVKADRLVTRLIGAGAGTVTVTELTKTYTEILDLLRATEMDLEGEVVKVAQDDSSTTGKRATLEFVVVLLVLIAAIALAFYLGRNLTLSLRRLREGALAVAHRDLPEAVSRLQDVESLGEGGVGRIVEEARDPIRLTDRDEFGQVAEAFNMVHREAIRVAAEQAALRTSVSAMFLSLARRSQALVDRMIGELDQIERVEEDPKRLAKLFDLDHLATRMRRNDENLLVLAGADVGAPRREDALLVDVLKASQSEVEMYHRVEFGATDTDVSVTAASVNDVVRLIAELLDNATRFSPPTTLVMAHGRRSGDQAVVQVEDRGLGISAEQLELINRRLAEPNAVDVTAFRLMGFAVIARLAARHGIAVRLLPHHEGGTIAEITLPAEIVVLPGQASGTTGRAASWTRPGPAPQTTRGTGRTSEIRPPIRSAPAPAGQRWAHVVASPAAELDLRPTPDRPALPTRIPQPTAAMDLPPAPLFNPAPAAPVSAQPVSAQPTWAQPSSGQPFSAQPVSAQPAWAQPVSAQPFPAQPVSAQPFPAQPVSAQPFPAQPVSAQPFPAQPVSAQPVSARPVSAMPAPAPIQVQMQHNWFEAETETPAASAMGGMPTAGYAPAPVSAVPASAPPVRPAPVSAAPASAPPHRPATEGAAVPRPRPAAEGAAVPRPRTAAEDRWQTVADDGWQRALAAAVPADAGITRSGLPKRIPQAQLVPGGVQERPRAQNRRSPDDIRGLLSAYTRGVQRGRTDGVAEPAAAASQAPKENKQ
ncbi:sensor histidine kinase [Actinoplanes regularis]|uniref:sensor histidine kinase n=1 Tax=Actinoplanes regularis TaxID=52697 RepID=UPI0024A0212C|nr:nitrate- and nitrite sensing domain-containing protein [Actinoplanes regularis]GLW31310.1 histidine kinase [Actinoplanes regularis]